MNPRLFAIPRPPEGLDHPVEKLLRHRSIWVKQGPNLGLSTASKLASEPGDERGS
jgi:hypothetical protein